MAGTWTGGGVLRSSDRTQEQLRCRADYDPAGRAELRLNLLCASASYNFDLTSSVQDRGGRQSVSLRPRGTNISEVSLELNRR